MLGGRWVATCPEVNVIAMIQEQINLAMQKQWNLSIVVTPYDLTSAIERWPDYTVEPV